MRDLKHTPNGYLARKTGCEGPKHDPYSYREYEYKRGPITYTLHLGLGVWLASSLDDNKATLDQTHYDENALVAIFAHLTGLTPSQCDKALDHTRRMSRRERFEYEMCMEASYAMLRNAQ